MRSLRGRLTLGLALVLAAVLAAAGALVERDVDADERAALDDRLSRTAELSRATALAAVEEELPGSDTRLDAVLRATRTSLRLTLAGRELFATGDAPPPRRATLPLGFSTFSAGGVRYRALASTLRDSELGGLARLEVVTRLTALEARRDARRRRLVLLGALALLATIGGVLALSGVLLRPLGRLRALTASIAADEDLSRRVPTDAGPSELRALAEDFNAMLARLERSRGTLRRFVADAGHELRTPLTSAQATLSTLARHPDLPPQRRAAMAQEALASHARLVALLDGLQLLARGESAELAPLDLVDVVQDAVERFVSRHPEISLDARLPAEAETVVGWEPGLESLVENLLENAARHGGGTVRATLSGRSIVVEDDGPGVPEEAHEQIFQPFKRLDPERPGSGLGLAIVAQQAALHGARLEVGRSEDLGGARFAVAF